jgi:mannosyltransferase
VSVPARVHVGRGESSASPPSPVRSYAVERLLFHATPILLLALTAALSFFRLGEKSLWHDEAFTLAVARSDAGTFWQSLTKAESFAGLYYSVVRLLPPLWHTEATLRAASAVFAVLTALTCYLVARRLWGFRVAVLSVLLLTISLFFVGYAQEARGYALAVWLVTLATWTLVRAVKRPTWGSWLSFGAISGVAAYAHFFAVLVLVGQLVSLVVHRSLVPWRKVAAGIGLALVLVLPLAAVLLSTNAGGRPLLPQTPIAVLFRDLAGVAPTRAGAVQASIYGLCCVVALAACLRSRRLTADSFLQWRFTLLVCWIVVPIALTALVSLVWPVFVSRYFVVCLPAVALLVAVGLAALRPALQAALLVVVLLVAAPGLRVYYTQDYKEGENWRALVNYVASDAQPGDRIVFLSHFGRRPFEYYLARHPGLASSLTSEYPSIPWGDYSPVVGEARVGNAIAQAGHLEIAKPARVWVVLLWGGFRTGDDNGAPFQRMLTDHYAETDYRFFGRYLKLALFQRKPEPAWQPTRLANEPSRFG